MLSRSNSARGLLMLAALVFAFAFAGSASAQTETGQVFGKVTDPNGAVVPNATVTLKAVETGAQRTTTTDDAGNYIITNIQPALYDITASASGFAPVTQRIQVTVGSRNSQDLTLGITGAKEQVNVVASEGGVEVNTQTPELSNVV